VSWWLGLIIWGFGALSGATITYMVWPEEDDDDDAGA
jgi:hypothetical protein